MKYIMINSHNSVKNMKRIIPLEKRRKLVLSSSSIPEKGVDAAEIEVNNSEFSLELKKQTDIVLRGFFKAKNPIRLTAIGLEDAVSNAIEKTTRTLERRKQDEKQIQRIQKLEALKEKIKRRRKNG